MSRIGYDPQYIQENGDFGSAMTLIAVVRFEQFVLFLLPCTCSRVAVVLASSILEYLPRIEQVYCHHWLSL